MIDGFVSVKPVYQGMYVTPEMELYKLADHSEVWVYADIYEPEFPMISLGQPATLICAVNAAAETRAGHHRSIGEDGIPCDRHRSAARHINAAAMTQG